MEQEELTIHTVGTDKRISKGTHVLGLEARSYAKLMATELGVTLSDLTAFDSMTVSQINKTISELAKTQSIERKSSLTQAQISNLAIQGRSRIEDLRNQSRNRIDHYRIQLEGACHIMQTRSIELAREMRTYAALDVSGGIDLAEQVRTILADGWYSLHDATQNSVEFITPQVALRYVHPELGIDKSLAMGKYRVIVKPMHGMVSVQAHEDNIITRNSYYHPHISGGTVCWGNAHDAYSQLPNAFNMVPALTALRSLLQSYNYDSPYERFEQFEYAAKSRDMLVGKLGNVWIENPINNLFVRLRMSYTGSVEAVRNLKYIYATASRFYTIGAEDSATYARGALLCDDSYHRITERSNTMDAIVYGELSQMSEKSDVLEYATDHGYDMLHKVNMEQLRQLSDGEILSILNKSASESRHIQERIL